MAGTIGPSPLRRTWYKFYVGLHWRENSYAPSRWVVFTCDMLDIMTAIHPFTD